MRIISRLDVKGKNLIKGINLEGLRVVGDPNVFAKKYYNEGSDEILFVDSVASLYNRNNLTEIVKLACKDIFVPFTVGGGIRNLKDAEKLFISGADKIAINTAAIQNPKLITELAKTFGSQAVVISIEAKKNSENEWIAYTNNGRENTNKNVLEWAKIATDCGAGEILLTSVDYEGTCKGFDYAIVKKISKKIKIPIIASGGFGKPEHMVEVVKNSGADAVAIAHCFHYNKFSLRQVRDYALSNNIKVRKFNQ